jgi:glycine cleavage system regulatory protein
MKDVVLTLLGPDRPGLVEALAAVVAEHGGNWLESRMAHLAGKFAGILRAEVPDHRLPGLVHALGGLESQGLKLVVEAAGMPPAQQGARAMDLALVGQDRPGIVREISQLLAAKGVNVEELRTDRTSAPMSGELIFTARARVFAPATVSAADLRAALERMESDLMVEIELAERDS